ncbi:MAG TPA: hypothetical protein VFQ47_00025 [Nitrososphaera sp.]|nr:hypothetical protein [Nitrososphaera sp.]
MLFINEANEAAITLALAMRQNSIPIEQLLSTTLAALIIAIRWRPNARINPPPDDTIQRELNQQMLMKGKLRAVGFNELLGALFGQKLHER